MDSKEYKDVVKYIDTEECSPKGVKRTTFIDRCTNFEINDQKVLYYKDTTRKVIKDVDVQAAIAQKHNQDVHSNYTDCYAALKPDFDGQTCATI